jgi:hypothetical protein
MRPDVGCQMSDVAGRSAYGVWWIGDWRFTLDPQLSTLEWPFAAEPRAPSDRPPADGRGQAPPQLSTLDSRLSTVLS